MYSILYARYRRAERQVRTDPQVRTVIATSLSSQHVLSRCLQTGDPESPEIETTESRNMPTLTSRTPVLTGVAVHPEVQTATFSLDSFKITDTRSRHEDTDYVSFTLLVRDANGKGTPQTLKKKMGNLNNGTFNVGLSFPNVVVPVNGSVAFNYLIVNSGHQSESDVYKALETAGGALADKGLVAGGTAIGSAILPGLGSILGALGGFLAGVIKNILTANCDGAVAAEQVTLKYADLMAKTASGPYSHETPNPGTDSATGCGSNSMYYVKWHIARGTPQPVREVAHL